MAHMWIVSHTYECVVLRMFRSHVTLVNGLLRVTYLCMGHVPFTRRAGLMYVCVWRDLCVAGLMHICVAGLFHVCETIHLNVWRDLFVCER